MPAKRKMNDMSSGESEEKLSKKAKLKLARERAAKFAERDKAKLEGKAGKKPGIAVSKAVKSKSPNHEVVQNDTEMMTRTAVAVKSPDEKMSLAERKKIAKKNAKQFAARDRAALKSKNEHALSTDPSPMDVVEQTQLPSTVVNPSIIPGTSKKQQNFGVAIDPNQVAEYERMRQMHYIKMQQQLAKQQQEMMQQSTLAASQHDQSAASQMSTDIPSQAFVGGVNNQIDVAAGGNGDEEIDYEDTMPPPTLMAQVSQQVLLNVQNEDMESENEKLSEGKEEEEIAIDNGKVEHLPPIDKNEQQLETTNRKARWLPNITSVIIIGVAISSIILMLPMPPDDIFLKLPSGDDAVIEKEAFCYYNSEPDSEDHCSHVTNGMECPKGAFCNGGKLVACVNPFQDISNHGNKCVLGEKYLPIKDALTNELVRHASQICDQSTKPKFKYAILQENNSTIPEIENEDIIEALKDEGFVFYDRDEIYVGLPEDFYVGLPIYCYVGNVGQFIVQEVGLLLLGILRYLSLNLLGFVSTYPELSLFHLILFTCFIWYRRYFAVKKKRQTDTVRTRELAYKTLEESSGLEHCAIHIRDEIAMRLYPNSKKDRIQLQKSIWPKIVDDVKRDTRVRKFQSFTRDGKTRDMWQWTAASKATSKS